MWTYRNGPETSSTQTEKFSKNSLLTSRNSTIPVRNRITSTIKSKQKQFAHLFIRNSCFIYLSGLLIGSICSRICNKEDLLQYAKYYTEKSLNLLLSQNYKLIFSNHYLTSLIQLSVILVCGFCAFGIILIPFIIFLKGFGSGCFFSLLYSELGISKGILGQFVFFLIPELMDFSIFASLCLLSWKVSKNLFLNCVHRGPANLTENCRKLFYRYLLFCIASILPHVLEVISAMLFTPLFI